MSLTRIERGAVLVGTLAEVRGGSTDFAVGRDAIVLYIANGASHEQRESMAVRARDIVAAQKLGGSVNGSDVGGVAQPANPPSL